MINVSKVGGGEVAQNSIFSEIITQTTSLSGGHIMRHHLRSNFQLNLHLNQFLKMTNYETSSKIVD